MYRLHEIRGDEIHIVSVEGDSLGTLQSIDQGGIVQPSETYPGPYAITPGPDAQVFDTSGKMMTEDITVGAIPSNYGLITWDGSTLTVS